MLNPHVHVPFSKLDGFGGFIRDAGLAPEIYFVSSDIDALAPDWLEKKVLPFLDRSPELSVHAPFMDLSPGAVDEKVRAVTVERFGKTLDMAEALRAKSVVFHSGYEKWKYALRTDIWLERSALTWRPLIERAKKAGIKIAIENIFEDEPGNLALLMERLGSEHFGVCFDTGHFNLFSKQKSLGGWLRALKKYILELHVHDNDGTSDQHRPIGEGTFPFKTLFEELKGMDVIYTVEAHSREDATLGLERLRGF